uniref:C-type lectin domain-containing protein n=2 Tax=Acrobeloides nanus TaxID=290746 RepID=A0A914D7G7_9BILA
MIADGQWSWSDGSNSNYVNWANGQPTSNTGDNCATQQFSDGRWYTRDCYLTRRPYFCEMSQVVTPCPTLPTPIGNNFTAGEWIYDETAGKCYLLLSYSFAGYPRFDISRQFCKSYGADDLVSIMSENENTAIGGYVVPFSMANHWFANDAAMIGLLNNGTGWQWVNGQKVSYTNWLSEPNSTSYGWGRLEYGYKAGYRNQWDLGGTFLYDGCAVIICEKVIQKN